MSNENASLMVTSSLHTPSVDSDSDDSVDYSTFQKTLPKAPARFKSEAKPAPEFFLDECQPDTSGDEELARKLEQELNFEEAPLPPPPKAQPASKPVHQPRGGKPLALQEFPTWAQCGQVRDRETKERWPAARFVILQLFDAFDRNAPMMARQLGYPDYLVQRTRGVIAREEKIGKELTRRGPRVQKQVQHAPQGSFGYTVKPRAPFKPDGRSASAPQKQRPYRAPPMWHPYRGPKGPEVARPGPGATPQEWRLYLAGIATSIKRQGHGPVLNDPADAIMRGFVGTRAAFDRATERARVLYPQRDVDIVPTRSSRLEIKCGLFVQGQKINSLAELHYFYPIFKRHRPLFRAAERYFEGKLSWPDMMRLERDFLRHFPRETPSPTPTSYTFGRDEIEDAKADYVARYQGGAHSVELRTDGVVEAASKLQQVRLNVHHELSLFPELQALARETVGQSRIRYIANLLSAIVAFCASGSAAGRAATVVQFVSSYPDIWGEISRLVYSGTQQQGPDSAMAFASATTLSVVKEFFGDLWRCSVPGVIEMAASLRKGFAQEAGKEWGKLLMQFFAEMIDRLRRCVKERSLSPLWGVTWNPESWTGEVRAVIRYHALLTAVGVTDESLKDEFAAAHAAGLPLWWAAPMSQPLYRESLRGLLTRGETIHRALPKEVSLRGQLEALRSFLTLLDAQAFGAGQRIAPFALCLFGPAGSGKSRMAEAIARAIGVKNGYDVSDSGTYNWRPGANFQDGLANHQWCVACDDIDQSVAPPSAGYQSHAQCVIDLVNNTPLPVEAAAVEMKGRLFAHPLLLTYCTNYSHMRLQGYIVDPSPVYRRFPYRAFVKASPAFESANGALDQAKAALSETHDMWNIQVEQYDPSKFDPKAPWADPPYKQLGSMTFPEFVVFIQARFKEHIGRQLAMLKKPIGAECPNCGLPTAQSCGCDATVVQQGFSDCFGLRQRAVLSLEDARRRALDAFSEAAYERLQRRLYLWGKQFWPRVALGAAGCAIVLVVATKAFDAYWQRQGREPAAAPAGWVRAAEVYGPFRPPVTPGPTFTRDELEAVVRRSLVPLRSGGFALVVAHNVVCYPTHLCRIGQVTDLLFPSGPVRLAPSILSCCLLPNPELCVVRVSGIPASKTARAFIPVVRDEAVSTFDEVAFLRPQETVPVTKNWQSRTRDGVLLHTNLSTTIEGECGLIYIGRVGTQWYIRGMHYLQITPSVGLPFTGAGFLVGRELECAIQRVGATFQGVIVPTSGLVKSGEGYFGPLPALSELATALERGAQQRPIGELHPRPYGTKFKTNVHRTLSAEFFEDLEALWCGKTPYWQGPVARGCMKDGTWWSPWQDVLLVGRANQTCFEVEDVVATMDFLNGIQRLDRQDYRFLTERESIDGIPGTWVNPINPRTSVGPPYNVKKYHHFSRELGETSFSPEMERLLDEHRAIIDGGDIPGFFARCVFKDEPRKPDAAARVFTILPCVANMLLKQYTSPIISFVRANFGFFECAVGIDMSSSEVEKLVEHLGAVGPLDRVAERDATKQDKSFTWQRLDMNVLVFVAIAKALGLDWRPVAAVKYGTKNVHYEIKGDVFQAAWNPSGQDNTVQDNSFDISRGSRYAYYRARPELTKQLFDEHGVQFMALAFSPELDFHFTDDHRFSFRKEVALVTYGDDHLRNLGPGVIMPQNELQIWREEWGVIMTDASKEGDGSLEQKLEDCSFLKRGFVFDHELQRHVAPLSLKSIVKMCVVGCDTTLSQPDHTSALLTNAMREAVLHGPVVYEQIRSRAEAASEAKGFRDNPYFVLQPYSYWREQMLADSFSVWGDYRTERAGLELQIQATLDQISG